MSLRRFCRGSTAVLSGFWCLVDDRLPYCTSLPFRGLIVDQTRYCHTRHTSPYVFCSGVLMQSYNARYASFAPQARSKSSVKGTLDLKWPHPASFLATPTSLASAGFYFNPSAKTPDAVSCFICDKGLADWDPEDDPAQIHSQKCPKCPWAMFKCAIDMNTNERSGSIPCPQRRLLSFMLVLNSFPPLAFLHHALWRRRVSRLLVQRERNGGRMMPRTRVQRPKRCVHVSSHPGRTSSHSPFRWQKQALYIPL